MKFALSLFLILALLSFNGCKEKKFKEGVVVAGGQYVTADTLNTGMAIYKEYCMACHGEKGDGKGVASKGLYPPPRNFTTGLIKFGDVASGELPHDEAIYKFLKHGLNGTAMLPWDLTEGQMNAVWQYIKTFAPNVWLKKETELGARVELTKDPYGLAHKDKAIEIGRDVYHATANCQACHRGYVSLTEYKDIAKRVNDEDVEELDSDFYKLKPQESEHGYMTIPPDFTYHSTRTIYNNNIEDIYLRLAAGVGGTTMPAWKGTIEDSEIWAVAYYVQHLMSMKMDPEKRNDLMEKLGK
jgi:mono/diheme cytochrome c family protein